MITIIKKNWHSIKKCMELSQNTEYNWLQYATKINSGLSSSCLTKKGCGDVIFFVERLNEYATLSSEYLKVAKRMTGEQIEFINTHREFLITIK